MDYFIPQRGCTGTSPAFPDVYCSEDENDSVQPLCSAWREYSCQWRGTSRTAGSGCTWFTSTTMLNSWLGMGGCFHERDDLAAAFVLDIMRKLHGPTQRCNCKRAGSCIHFACTQNDWIRGWKFAGKIVVIQMKLPLIASYLGLHPPLHHFALTMKDRDSHELSRSFFRSRLANPISLSNINLNHTLVIWLYLKQRTRFSVDANQYSSTAVNGTKSWLHPLRIFPWVLRQIFL